MRQRFDVTENLLFFCKIFWSKLGLGNNGTTLLQQSKEGPLRRPSRMVLQIAECGEDADRVVGWLRRTDGLDCKMRRLHGSRVIERWMPLRNKHTDKHMQVRTLPSLQLRRSLEESPTQIFILMLSLLKVVMTVWYQVVIHGSRRTGVCYIVPCKSSRKQTQRPSFSYFLLLFI
jgi:hypothetical protein